MNRRPWLRFAACLAALLLAAGLYVRAEFLGFLRTRQCQQGTSPWARLDSWFCQEARVTAWLATAVIIVAVVAGAVLVKQFGPAPPSRPHERGQLLGFDLTAPRVLRLRRGG